ncbi:FkbM family methyltransferase [Sphingomonas sp. Leaf33]|uniref:FkbM family methyltransferase n=1 Tax=Sphingomonas sp. Leaf33 TaxID=1736215 RepID=UPI0009E89976|nr:FkbM family methyltransferase [Sphingomonas sp. Leaf33]
MSFIDDAAVTLVRRLPVGYFRVARLLANIRPSLRSYPTQTAYGTLACDISERVCVPLVREGEYKHWAKDAAYLKSLPLRSDSVVIDVGANVGCTVAIFSAKAGHVHAFEPAHRALRLLESNKWPNVSIYPFAVSNYNGTTTFAESNDLDISRISETGITVPVRTLDSFAIAADVIKVDVEGFEPQVFEGAAETLKRSPLIIFEALDSESRIACENAILSANDSYKFEQISDLNYVART